MEKNTDIQYNDILPKPITLTYSPLHCSKHCIEEPKCNFWLWQASEQKCYLKSSDDKGRSPYNGLTSGARGCGVTGEDTMKCYNTSSHV